jgi:hypothetical protein
MDYTRALISALDGKAILFAGAGFSLGAKSVSGPEFPTGRDLAKILCGQAKVPETDDLKVAATRYLKIKRADELVDFLRKTFSAKEVKPKHEKIAAIPWKAIYTTNYDDVIEMGAKASGKKLVPVTLTDRPNNHRESDSSVVHINGFIDRLNESTLLGEFKLTNTSYLTTQFRESEWCDLFLHHIRSAQAIFFVGYSLYDIDIQEIFYADKSMKEKTFFIQKEGMTEEEIFYSDLSEFGTIMPIGLDKFAEDLSSVDPLAISSDKSLILIGLEEMKLPDDKLVTTAEDVFSLLLRGESNSDLISEQIISSVDNDYVFKRDALERAKDEPSNYMIVGDLGNGKTTLLRCICAALLKQGKRCFWIKDEAYDCMDEIDAVLKLSEPAVIVFDNYTKKLDLIDYTNLKRRSDTILIFSARTLLHKNFQEDLYYKKIRVDVAKTLEIDCNKLSNPEISSLTDYFSKFGLWGEKAADHKDKKIRYIKKTCNSELHGVLLDLLSSPEIQSRFSSLFGQFNGSRQMTKTLVAAFCLNLLNITQPSAHMIAAVTGDGTIFTPAFRSNVILRHFFNNDRDVITPKSAALAEFCMKNFPDPQLLVDCLIDICTITRKKAATERKYDLSRFYWDLYRDMASFSNAKRMLPEIGKRELLIRFYEGLRKIELERDNPLFWLQYAMARMNEPKAGDLEQASRHLETALAIARSKKGFTTVDIETQQARLYIEYALHSSNDASEAFGHFMQAHNRLAKITKEEIYKTEPYRPMHNYERFYSKYGEQFTLEQNQGVYDALENIMKNIKRLPVRVGEEQVILTTRRILREIILKIEKKLISTTTTATAK